MKVHNNTKLFDRRKELRRNSTSQEEILWNELRNGKLGLRFRRQHSVGGYILDFYCFSKRLIVEVDGDSHNSTKEYDAVRDKFFTDLGYKVLRFKNRDVETKLGEVLNKIKQSL